LRGRPRVGQCKVDDFLLLNFVIERQLLVAVGQPLVYRLNIHNFPLPVGQLGFEHRGHPIFPHGPVVAHVLNREIDISRDILLIGHLKIKPVLVVVSLGLGVPALVQRVSSI
jgi:hypothetical protein